MTRDITGLPWAQSYTHISVLPVWLLWPFLSSSSGGSRRPGGVPYRTGSLILRSWPQCSCSGSSTCSIPPCSSSRRHNKFKRERGFYTGGCLLTHGGSFVRSGNADAVCCSSLPLCTSVTMTLSRALPCRAGADMSPTGQHKDKTRPASQTRSHGTRLLP